MKRYTKAEVIQLVETFYHENHRPPREDEMKERNGLPSSTTFKYYTGKTANRYIRDKYPEALSNSHSSLRKKKSTDKAKSKEKIIAEYRWFIKLKGKLPGVNECRENQLAYPATFKKVVGLTPKMYFESENGENGIAASQFVRTHEPVIYELMERLGVTPEELSMKSGVSKKAIRSLATRKATDYYRDLYAIARALNVPMEILYRTK